MSVIRPSSYVPPDGRIWLDDEWQAAGRTPETYVSVYSASDRRKGKGGIGLPNRSSSSTAGVPPEWLDHLAAGYPDFYVRLLERYFAA